MHDVFAAQCGLEVNELASNIKKIDFKNIIIKIEHVLCVTRTIISEISKNEDALNWIQYHLQLKESILKMTACNVYVGMDKNAYVERKKK